MALFLLCGCCGICYLVLGEQLLLVVLETLMHYVYGVGNYLEAYFSIRRNVVGGVYSPCEAARLYPELVVYAHEKHTLYNAL